MSFTDRIQATEDRWEQRTELCRQGDPEATITMLRRAYRTQDHRLFEIGLAGGFLCQDPESDAKRYAYMLLGALAGPTELWFLFQGQNNPKEKEKQP